MSTQSHFAGEIRNDVTVTKIFLQITWPCLIILEKHLFCRFNFISYLLHTIKKQNGKFIYYLFASSTVLYLANVSSHFYLRLFAPVFSTVNYLFFFVAKGGSQSVLVWPKTFCSVFLFSNFLFLLDFGFVILISVFFSFFENLLLHLCSLESFLSDNTQSEHQRFGLFYS